MYLYIIFKAYIYMYLYNMCTYTLTYTHAYTCVLHAFDSTFTTPSDIYIELN